MGKKLPETSMPGCAVSQLASFDKLSTWSYAKVPAAVQANLDAARRQSTFDEVVSGFNERQALF